VTLNTTLVVVWAFAVTEKAPEGTPSGTIAMIAVSDHRVVATATPLKEIVLVP
jgi:hypothetical protein